MQWFSGSLEAAPTRYRRVPLRQGLSPRCALPDESEAGRFRYRGRQTRSRPFTL